MDVQELTLKLRRRLLREMTADGHWEGRLSSSALAGAIAVFALSKVDFHKYAGRIGQGLDWIASHVNDDGGWGDSPESPSNITATILCWVALSEAGKHREVIEGAEEWLRRAAGSVEPADIRRAILERYGDDRTFAAPILTMCALSGRFGLESEVWDMVPQLPFELSVLPHQLFGLLRMSVVSYALPALIAIGYVRHTRIPSRNPLLRLLRKLVTRRALWIAEKMQPVNGGYEEATPLTGFVTMSLAAAGEGDSQTVARGVDFLVKSMRRDGSWPIDTNLATWVTTLAVKAIPADAEGTDGLSPERRRRIRQWLLGQQHEERHALTYGAPGGWAWSDLVGAMPDADDTPGVLLALRRVGDIHDGVRRAAGKGVCWLLDLRNTDGGTPTFAKGWGKLPFDRSCPDVTAHTTWALDEWYDDLPAGLRRRVRKNQSANLRYLRRAQDGQGYWVPLWFGNQWTANQEGPVYGTARVVDYLRRLTHSAGAKAEAMIAGGCRYLVGAQNPDGGWGGTGEASSIEETALAVKALLPDGPEDVIARGLDWLVARVDTDNDLPAAPIGLYFAKLWYSERLYPLIFALDALEAAADSG
ncbi:prenyltransferase/squalene oxidase repeat-containing protein [Verrucomicrobiota bacterium]